MAKSVLILGGGFAGLSAARRLARAGRGDLRVQLVDQRDASEFSPLYPDMISRRIRPASIRYPLRPFCRRHGIEFTQARVRGLDLDARRVATDAGEIVADLLICCLGCANNYHGNRDMQDRSFGLKSIAEGRRIEQAAGEHVRQAMARGEPANFLVVGGGYTGFETASHVAYLLRGLTGLPWRRLAEAASISILELGGTVLGNVPEDVRQWAIELIGRYGIQVRTKLTAQAFDASGCVRLSDGSAVPNALVLWAAGVAPGEPVAGMDAPKVRGGRLRVDEFLRLDGRERIFAAGDVAGPTAPGAGQPLRMSVQFSLTAGRRAAENVLAAIRGRPPKAYRPLDPGYVVPLARGAGVGSIFGVELHGKIPYFLHYFMSAFRSWGPNRAAVVEDLLGL